MSEKKLIELQESMIEKHVATAFRLITEEKIVVKEAQKDMAGRESLGFRSTVVGATSNTGSQQKTIQLINSIKSINEKSPLLSDCEHHVVSAIYRGLAISGALYDTYAKISEMDRLLETNRAGRLTPDERTKLGSLQKASAAATLWVVSNFLLREFAEKSQNSLIEIDNVDQIVFDNATTALTYFVYELERNIRIHARNEDDLVATVAKVCDKVLSKIEMVIGNLEFVDYFTAYIYQVEKDKFEINGFTRSSMVRKQELVMVFKKPEEVIGNAIAKHQAMRISKMIMCYDFKRKLNPFAELGGFPFTFMGDGNPGTGKTTLIQMMAGLMNDYCKNINVPFHYENLATDAIDSYQGKSGRIAKQFIKNVTNPDVIGFGTIDDIDQVAGKRGDKKASEGALGITAALMEAFAGANTKILGNATFGMFSNYPDQVDDALRQRASARFLIDGPQSLEDFIDIAALFAGKNCTIPNGDIELFVTQQIKQAVSKSYEKHNLPQTDALKAIYETTIEQVGKLDNMASIGRYLFNIKEIEPRFTGRAVANIFNSAKTRTMDFDMPDEWFEHPETFLLLPYEDKKNMIMELQSPLDEKILLQEINRYADSEFRYSNKSEEADINELLRQYKVQQKAAELLKNGQ